MAELEEKEKQPCVEATETQGDSSITPNPKEEKDLDTKENKEHLNSQDVQQVMSLSKEERGQGQGEEEHTECSKDPGLINNKTDEQDQDIVREPMEKSGKQEEKTVAPEAKKSELAENGEKEGEVNKDLIEKNANQDEKNDNPEEKKNNIEVDEMTAESGKEKHQMEEGHQGQDEGENRKCYQESSMKNEKREQKDENMKNQMDKSGEQEEKTQETAENKSELTKNSLEEGGKDLEMLEKATSQCEKNNEPEGKNITADGNGAGMNLEKEKSQDDEEKTSSHVEKEESQVEPVSLKTNQGEFDNKQAEESSTKAEKQKKSIINKLRRAKECYIIQTGNTCNSHVDFLGCLEEKYRKIIKMDKAEKCKFIQVFCPVVSRAGTDIEAAMRKLNDIQVKKPAVLVVLHSTIDPECFVPDSSRAVTRENTIAVDCLFHEDKGLYKCPKNKEAVRKVTKWLKTKPWTVQK